MADDDDDIFLSLSNVQQVPASFGFEFSYQKLQARCNKKGTTLF